MKNKIVKYSGRFAVRVLSCILAFLSLSSGVKAEGYKGLLIEDSQGIWQSQTSIDIFAESYEGTEEAGTGDRITVENGGTDPWKVIAPGTEKSYTFRIKNPGETAGRYRLTFEEAVSGEKLPLEVRIKRNENYLVGGEGAWENIEVLRQAVYEGLLGGNGSVSYTLEWRWLFEKDDEQDTYLGNEAVRRLLEQRIIIKVRQEESDSTTESGPPQIPENRNPQDVTSPGKVKTGDQSRLLFWSVLLGAAALVLTVLLGIRFDKKDRIGKFIRKVGSICLLLLMLSVIGCNLYMIVQRVCYQEAYPMIFGYTTAVAVSGSMADVIEIDDLVVVHREDHYELGDIVTYQCGKSLVTHRIVGKTKEGFRTKGDANNIEDLDPVKEEKILGKVVTVIPGIGKILYLPNAFINIIYNNS